MSATNCPGCGKAVAVERECASCNLPPRHAGSRLTMIFLGSLLALGAIYLFQR